MTQALASPHPGTLARSSDPSTSHEAAARVSALASDHYNAILDVMGYHASLGAEEIADACGLEAYQVRKRLPELQRQGLVGVVPVERVTRSGRRERTWVRLAKPA